MSFSNAGVTAFCRFGGGSSRSNPLMRDLILGCIDPESLTLCGRWKGLARPRCRNADATPLMASRIVADTMGRGRFVEGRPCASKLKARCRMTNPLAKSNRSWSSGTESSQGSDPRPQSKRKAFHLRKYRSPRSKAASPFESMTSQRFASPRARMTRSLVATGEFRNQTD